MEDEDMEYEEEIAKVDLEEAEVLQEEARPWTIIMLVYCLQHPTPSIQFDVLQP